MNNKSPGSQQAGGANSGLELSRPAYLLTVEEAVQQLRAQPDDGLSEAEAKVRLQQAGPNELDTGGGVNVTQILVKQIFNAMIMVLILAMIVSFAIKSWIEAGVVAAVVALNVGVGFYQEYSAEKTMDSLRSLSSPTATVIREGKTVTVRSADIVPGDIVEVKTGDTIPADMRIVEAMTHFETDEMLLTGESLPVAKSAAAAFNEVDEVGVGDHINMAYSSSTVTKGRAKGVVAQTGMLTELGLIAKSLQGGDRKVRHVRRGEDGKAPLHRYVEAGAFTVTDQIGRFLGVNVGTPLQRKLSWLAILLFFVAVIFAIICVAANGFQNRQEVIIYAVGTGLAMIPSSLVVVLTITMAVGVKIMVEKNVIVRKLDSLEALGAVTNICSDKTGTLTQGKMVVRKAWIIAKGTYSVAETNDPIDPTAAEISFDTDTPQQTDQLVKTEAQRRAETEWHPAEEFLEANQHLREYLHIATFCNLATVNKHQGSDDWDARGDPTEIAIQVFASRFGYNRRNFTHAEPAPTWTQVAEYPFDSDVKRMSVIYRENVASDPEKEVEGGHREWALMKGAVERVLAACTTVQTEHGVMALEEEKKQTVLRNMEVLAGQGLRVLALASKLWDEPMESEDWAQYPRTNVERDMTLLGLIGLYDPPRPETAGAVMECHRAGINVHMVTGDHPQTARAIARDVGIIPRNVNSLAPDVISSMVMTAAQFDRLSEQEIDNLATLPLVIARCAPQTKVRMIEALHRRRKFVAMTGDGVNDSPALKRADVGIGMGLAGSDVAKDASDIVLTDDNFASILNAISEGRRMFDNIKKFVLHLLAENIAQGLTLLIGLAFKDSNGLSVYPISPIEILWLIIVTSSFPAMGLGMEAASDDVMRRPPHNLKAGVFTAEVLIDMLVYGLWMAALCLASFSLVVWGFGHSGAGGSHLTGTGCNESIEGGCETVFRARTTAFVALIWCALILAWEMVHMRRSFFRMEPKPQRPATLWARNIWRNRFLFWSNVCGIITIFPIVYIPGLNEVVFKHGAITWEWGIVFIASGMFMAGVEAWKWVKRIYIRHFLTSEKVVNPETALAEHTFDQYTSFNTQRSEEEKDLEAQKA